jgi:hypothetical protein
LKTNIFISKKSLDTPLFRLIRFRQKVLTALPPLELFSLEEEAAYCRAAFSFPRTIISPLTPEIDRAAFDGTAIPFLAYLVEYSYGGGTQCTAMAVELSCKRRMDFVRNAASK